MPGEVALVIFLLVLVVLVILLIPVVLQFRSSLTKVNRTLDIVNKELPAVMENIADITDSLNVTSLRVENAVEDVVELEKVVIKQVKDPLVNLAEAIAFVLQFLNKLVPKK